MSELILRLTIPLGAIALATTILLGVLAEHRERSVIGQALVRTAARLAMILDANLTERSDDAAILAALPMVRQPVDATAAREVFDALVARQPAFAWIGRFDRQGVVLAASGGLLQGQSGAQRPVFVEGVKGSFIGDVHDAVLLAKLLPSPPGGEPLRFIDVAHPIQGKDGGVDGVLATHLSWSWVRTLFDRMLLGFDRERGVELLILDRQDRVLAGPADAETQVLRLEGLLPASAARPEHWAQEIWPSGKDYVFAYSDSAPGSLVGQLGWRVMVRQPAALALSPVRELRVQLAIVALLLTVGIGVLAWIQARRITQPLAAIMRAAEGIARGRNEFIPHGSRLREVASLALTLQHMVHTLTHREQALDQMHTLAHRDALTGLHNRRALELHMDMAVERAVRSGERFAVLALDLDGFKAVNDTHGHANGDVLLREAARRLEDVVRSSEMLSRLGGDEFVVLIAGAPERVKSDAAAVAGRILASFDKPFAVAGQTVAIGCSIGIAVGANEEDTPRALLLRADQALYDAKRAGRGQIAWADAGVAA